MSNLLLLGFHITLDMHIVTLIPAALQDKVASAQVKGDKLAAAVSKWGSILLRKAFSSWKERHAAWQQRHAKIAKAAAVWHNRAVAAAWQQWQATAIYQQELRLRLSGAVGWCLLPAWPIAIPV